MRWLGLVLLLAGCAHKPECAFHGGSDWHELRSAHFVVRTNLDVETAKKATVDLERVRIALLHTFPDVPSEARPVDVVLLSNSLQVENLTAQPQLRGARMQDWRGTLLLISAEGYLFNSTIDSTLLAHELTHQLSAYSLRRQPRWLAEGLATYLETIAIDPVLGTAHRGKANVEMLTTVRKWGALPIEQLWSWEGDAGFNTNWHRYASAWFWVHLLLNKERHAFEAFIAKLRSGEDPHAAWDATFAHLGREARVKLAEAYLEGGVISTQFFELGPVPTEVNVRPLANAEAHAALSRTAAVAGQWERARSEALMSVKLDRESPSALEADVVTQPDPRLRLKRARKLVAIDPTNASGWLLLALGLERGEERTQALEKAVELDPQQVIALCELGRARSEDGRQEEALALVQRAMAAAPFEPKVLTVSAGVLFRAGRCNEAVAALSKAIELLPHQAPAGALDKLLQKLGEYQRCGAAQLPPSPTIR